MLSETEFTETNLHYRKLLKNKHFLIQCPIRIASLVLGKYSHSIPFLVTSVCYFSRRDALHKWGMLLLSLYRRIENITAFLGGAVLNPIETIERFGEGLDQETRSLKAALRVIAGGAPPKAIQEMDDHLARFEAYFNQREGLILNYQEKLSGSREALNRITVEVSAYKGEVERNIEQLNQMFAELDRDDDGFLENLLKEALGVPRLLEQKEEYLRQAEALQKLSAKVKMLASGISRLDAIDREELNAYRAWKTATSQAFQSLGVFAGPALFFTDLPSLFKKALNIKMFGATERFDDTYMWKRQKEVVGELAPKGVALLSKSISILSRARARVTQMLDNENESAEAFAKSDLWRLEILMTNNSQMLILESMVIFWKKLFPKDLVGGLIHEVQSSLANSRPIYRQQVEALSPADQQLLGDLLEAR